MQLRFDCEQKNRTSVRCDEQLKNALCFGKAVEKDIIFELDPIIFYIIGERVHRRQWQRSFGNSAILGSSLSPLFCQIVYSGGLF